MSDSEMAPGGPGPESPNARMRRQAAERAQRRRELVQSSTSDATTQHWQIDPELLGPAGNPVRPSTSNDNAIGTQGSLRRRRSPSPEPYRDLTPNANELLSNPNKRLKTGSEADLLHFARARPDQRMLLMYHALLQAQDRQQDMTTKHWTMPKELKDNIATFTYAVLMSPLIPTYRNLLIQTILDLLKHHGHLPDGLTGTNLKHVRRAISSTATNYRSAIKKTLIQSIKKKWHVSKLAEQLLAKAPDLKLTSGLLSRLAFIRFQLVNAPTTQLKGEGFWPHVSDKLKEMKSGVDAVELAEILKGYLDDDELLYTNGSSKPTVASPEERSDLQRTIDDSAEQIKVVTVEQDSDAGEDDDAEEGADS